MNIRVIIVLEDFLQVVHDICCLETYDRGVVYTINKDAELVILRFMFR